VQSIRADNANHVIRQPFAQCRKLLRGWIVRLPLTDLQLLLFGLDCVEGSVDGVGRGKHVEPSDMKADRMPDEPRKVHRVEIRCPLAGDVLIFVKLTS
jgi:hypothetical protein